MEKLIEARLINEYGHSNAEIEQFYEDFKQDMKLYEQEDLDTVDILYSMVDFVKFKKSMLTYVKGAINTTATKEEESEQNQLMTTAGSTSEEQYADFQSIMNEPLEGKDSLWKKKSERKEFGKHGWTYSIFQKKQPGKTDILRINASFKGIKKDQLLKYYLNPPPGQQQMIKEQRTIERIDENTTIDYWRFKMPMMSDRDNVMSIHQSLTPDGSEFLYIKTVERDDCPPVPGVVRMFLFTRGLVSINKESPEDTIDYTEISYFNLNGYFPARLMNMVIAGETQKEFQNMYTYLLKQNE